MLPLLELAKVVRPFIANVPEIKTYISEILTLMGQVQFNLSLRRRYLMKPDLKGQFQALCNMKTPISTMLYGDDIQKEIKLEDHWSYSSPERLSHCKLMIFKLIENPPMKVYAWTLLTPGAWPNLTQGHDWHNL